MLHLFQDYIPHAGQSELHNAGTRFVAVCAGVRSGKTFGAAREFLRRVYADRLWKSGPLLYWAVAPTHDLCNVQQREIMSILSAYARTLVAGQNKSERSLDLAGDIRIEFKSAHNPELLVGVGLDGLWIDEAARVHTEAWKGQLRMRLSDRAGFGLFSTTPLSRNWFYDEIWRRGDTSDAMRDPAYASVKFTTEQNTSVPSLIAEVEQARRDLPPRYFAREYLASFDAFSGLVYDEFEPRVHTAAASEMPRAFAETRVGVDWGFRNPGAMVVVGRDGDGAWWVVEEVVRPKMAVDSSTGGETWLKVARDLAARHRPTHFLCDPSRPEHIRTLRVAGLPAKAARNEVSTGIQRVATLMHFDPAAGGPSLRISKVCTRVLSEIRNYRWRDDDPAAEEPVKEDDHALDALRYALHHDAHEPAFW